jgi:hypothetical protein
MSDKKLTILGIVAAVMVVWAVVQSHVSNRVKSESNEPAYLIQGLDTDEIGSIVLGTGEEKVTLKRENGHFVVTDKSDYPAKTSQINDLISKCLDIKTEEFVTDNPANLEDLEVTEDKASRMVKFMTPEPNSVLLAGVIVGKTEELGNGTYVRLLSNDKALNNKVYLTSNAPWFSTSATNYIDQDLVKAKRDDIVSVTVNSPNGQYTLKPKEGSKEDVVLENMPAGKKLKSSDARSVFTALTSLRFDDVKKRPADFTFDRQYVCKLRDSTVYTISLAKKDDKTYAACTAVFTDTTPVEKAPVNQGGEVESEEQLKKKEAKLLGHDNAQKFATDHEGWIYEIADWKAKNLTKNLSDLLEDEKPAAKATEDANAVTPIVPFDATAQPTIEEPNTPTTQDPNAAKATP